MRTQNPKVKLSPEEFKEFVLDAQLCLGAAAQAHGITPHQLEAGLLDEGTAIVLTFQTNLDAEGHHYTGGHTCRKGLN